MPNLDQVDPDMANQITYTIVCADRKGSCAVMQDLYLAVVFGAEKGKDGRPFEGLASLITTPKGAGQAKLAEAPLVLEDYDPKTNLVVLRDPDVKIECTCMPNPAANEVEEPES